MRLSDYAEEESFPVFEKNDPRFQRAELRPKEGNRQFLEIYFEDLELGYVTLKQGGGGIAVPAELEDGAYSIGFIRLEDWVRHKGLGPIVYDKLAEYIMDTYGKNLISDPVHLSDDAKALWERLAARGYALETGFRTGADLLPVDVTMPDGTIKREYKLIDEPVYQYVLKKSSD